MPINFKDLKVGDTVFWVPHDHREFGRREHLTVQKIARKYTYIGPRNFPCVEYSGRKGEYVIGQVCDYPHGSIYATEQDFLDEAMWNHVQIEIRHLKTTPEMRKKIIELLATENELPEKFSKTKAEITK